MQTTLTITYFNEPEIFKPKFKIHYRLSIIYFNIPGSTYHFSRSKRTRRLKPTLGTLGILCVKVGEKKKGTDFNHYSAILFC